MKKTTLLRVGGAFAFFGLMILVGEFRPPTPWPIVGPLAFVVAFEWLVVRRFLVANVVEGKSEPVLKKHVSALELALRFGCAFVILGLAAASIWINRNQVNPGLNTQPKNIEQTQTPTADGNGAAGELDKTLSAAKTGDLDAQVRLSQIYLAGKLVPRDLNKAVEWAEAVAAQGHPAGEYQLALLYLLGTGVTTDEIKAEKLLLKAADKGLDAAIGELSQMYTSKARKALTESLNGAGAKPNFRDAYFWSLLAAARGDAMGTMNRDYAEKQLSDAVRLEIQARAGKWRPNGK